MAKNGFLKNESRGLIPAASCRKKLLTLGRGFSLRKAVDLEIIFFALGSAH